MIIGVHSAKFPAEQITANIREAVMRHDMQHPVVNDADFQLWGEYAVRAWPTVVLVDPRGKVAAQQAGEIQANEVAAVIRELLAAHAHQLDPRPLELLSEAAGETLDPLRYPGKVLAPGPGRLWVADTGHHRLLEIYLDPDRTQGEIVSVWGNGQAGFRDGAAGEAQFHHPHGLALAGQTLYVADTENHAIRALDLAQGQVRTVAGTGEKAPDLSPPRGAGPREIPLRSPWALWAQEEVLFIAMAGSHQIWALIREKELGIFAGSGAEALVDGSRAMAAFNQPSDLALALGSLFVADPEASAIRAIALGAESQVTTLVGQGLFDFGDEDGIGSVVRLQHPMGLTQAGGALYIADSYNHKIKVLDPASGRVQTLIGCGDAGSEDGPFWAARLYEPQGVAVAGSHLYIADTNNHLIRVADLELGLLHTLALRWPPAPN